MQRIFSLVVKSVVSASIQAVVSAQIQAMISVDVAKKTASHTSSTVKSSIHPPLKILTELSSTSVALETSLRLSLDIAPLYPIVEPVFRVDRKHMDTTTSLQDEGALYTEYVKIILKGI